MEIKNIVNSKIIAKLNPKIGKAAALIKEHIEQKTPIIIRHHGDADGYCGAIALEHAILPMIQKTAAKERSTWYIYSRRPALTPYYSYEDANKDLTYFFNERNLTHKQPLMIIVDNGSSDEDLLALKKLKVYDVDVIVIDHHPPSNLVDEFIDIHINSNHAGCEYDYSAGMLCAEIGNRLNPKLENLGFISAVSVYADKVKSEVSKEYLKLAQKEGFSDEFIRTAADVIDFEVASLGFFESRRLVDDLFGADEKRQREIMKILKPEVERKKALAFNSAKHYSHISKTPKLNIVMVPVSEVSLRGNYPYSGKIVGMVHDFYAKDFGKPTVSVGISADMMILRGTTDTSLDVNRIISEVRTKFPHAQVRGGGHAKAGSIRFVPAAFEEVKNYVLGRIRS